MKSILKVLLLGSLMIVSRLNKHNWQLTPQPVEVIIPATYPMSGNELTKTVNTPIQQLYISQR
ncbi:hypothetical protein [Adhaeribacter arboris]|nr:hypothetical protein [Adhaeribacter arboris]